MSPARSGTNPRTASKVDAVMSDASPTFGGFVDAYELTTISAER